MEVLYSSPPLILDPSPKATPLIRSLSPKAKFQMH